MDRAAVYALDNPITAHKSFNYSPVELDSINEALLGSKRVFPIDLNPNVVKAVGQRKSTLPLEKITMLVDSTVSIRPPRKSVAETTGSITKHRYNKSVSRRQQPPLLSITNVNEKDKV